MAGRRVGVEQELLLVGPATRYSSWHDGGQALLDRAEVSPQGCSTIDELVRQLADTRAGLADETRGSGVSPVAAPASLLTSGRADAMADGRGGRCVPLYGLRVQVEAVDTREAVTVADGLRPWLPLLLATSANSPIWGGRATGYASFRSHLRSRAPASGPAEPYRDQETLNEVTRALRTSGAAEVGPPWCHDVLVTGVHTVEVHVCDPCTSVEDLGLIAALLRALVDTLAQDHGRSAPAPAVRTDVLRAAHWRAARVGIEDHLLDPFSLGLTSPRAALQAAVDYARPALDMNGDRRGVDRRIAALLERGSGAARQLAMHRATGDLGAVIRDLARRTVQGPST